MRSSMSPRPRTTLAVGAALAVVLAVLVLAWLTVDAADPSEPAAGVLRSRPPDRPVESGSDGVDVGPELPLAGTEAEPIELLDLDDQDAIRGSPRVLSRWGRPPRDGQRAPCTIVVIDWEDRPVAGAVVHLWANDRPSQRGHVKAGEQPVALGPIDAVTDAEGRCTVQPQQHRPRVRVEKDGVGSSAWMPLAERGEGDQPREVLVPLRPNATLRGTVVQPKGRAAPGATVQIGSIGSDPTVAKSVVADGSGRFECEVPSLEPLSVRLDVPGTKTRRHRLELAPGEVRDIRMRLPGAYAIRGSFCDAQGQPVIPDRTAWVHFWPDRELLHDEEGFEDWLNHLRTKVDDSGRFEFELDRPARGMLTAWGKFAGLSETPVVTVDVENPQPDVVLRLCEPASIAGRVVDESGGPLVGFEVTASADREVSTFYGPKLKPKATELYGGASTETTSDGRFVLAPLHPRGRYTVLAREESSGRVLSLRNVEAGTQELLLACGTEAEHTSALAIVVTAASTGERLDDFSLDYARCSPTGGFFEKWLRPGHSESGLATLEGRRIGDLYDLVVSADGLACAYVGGIAAIAEGAVVPVALPNFSQVELRVTRDGRPAPWPVVVATRDESAQEALLHHHGLRRGRGDKDGVLWLRDLEPGSYSLVVGQGSAHVSLDIHLAPGERRTLDVEVR